MNTYANSFRTITAKFAGTCKRCNGTIAAGQTIRYGGKGRTYHLAAVCGVQQLAPMDDDAPIVTAPTAPTPQQLMSATIAASLQETFTSLLAQPARLGDIEPRDDGRDNGAPFVDDRDSADREADPEPVPVPVTRPRPTIARQAPTRRRTLAWTPPVSQTTVSADDLL